MNGPLGSIGTNYSDEMKVRYGVVTVNEKIEEDKPEEEVVEETPKEEVQDVTNSESEHVQATEPEDKPSVLPDKE